MEITKVWNPTRKFRLLEQGATRRRENQAIIQAIEEQLNQTGPTLIPSGTNRSGAKSHHSSQSQVGFRGRKGYKGKTERVRPNDPEGVGLGERSTQEPEIVVNTSRISSPTNRNITPTQTEHNAVADESNLDSDKLWLQMSQFAVQTQEQLDDFKQLNGRLKRN
ncbi:hypothetical protein O181_030002 [Austropuccinia psidii MF-1]|uniref:Uncharacterized protein n=1 Tax=Austropuccinia psidii MF-1 TaxID=1389203 RepID=A0A9Q3H410_9BASI|nr:hypothetical protein [Austropuccinia psidii MF-1]